MVRHKHHASNKRKKRNDRFLSGGWIAKEGPAPVPKCEETGKAIFHSEHSARKSIVGQLSAKHIRVYRCDHHPSHFHVTKTYNGRLDKK